MILDHAIDSPEKQSAFRPFLVGRLAVNLSYFLELRERGCREHAGHVHPGLCADINPLTGEFRPVSEQRLWAWGDGRAVGIWSAILLSGVLSPAHDKIRKDIREYIDSIYSGLRRRFQDNGGRVPFTCRTDTERPDDHPANNVVPLSPDDHSTRFAAGGFIQYGLLCRDTDALVTGMEIIRENVRRIERHWREVQAGDPARIAAGGVAHGPRMIVAGILIDALLSMEAAPEIVDEMELSEVHCEMIGTALQQIRHILRHHFDADRGVFWERCAADGSPYRETPPGGHAGVVVTDPGHATELSGFVAEAAPFAGEAGAGAGEAAVSAAELIKAASAVHLFADSIGFTGTGVMNKYVDMETGAVLPDTQADAAEPRPTAPWWNVAEHAAAALRLYTHTGDPRFLETHRQAHNALYRYYMNPAINDQPVQTVDPETLEQIDVKPATGNFDPLHYARSMLRQIQSLDRLVTDSSSTPR